MKNEPRVPRQERSIEKKEQIISAGLKLFSEAGYHKTNTKEIAREAGVSTGTFYAYFADKRDLFMEVFKRYNEEINRVLASLPVEQFRKPGSERDFILLLVDSLIEAHNVSPAFHQELEAMILSDEEVGRVMDNIRKKALEQSRELFKAWLPNLRPRNINVSSILVQYVIEEIVHTIKFAEIDVKPELLKNELVDMVYRYLYN